LPEASIAAEEPSGQVMSPSCVPQLGKVLPFVHTPFPVQCRSTNSGAEPSSGPWQQTNCAAPSAQQAEARHAAFGGGAHLPPQVPSLLQVCPSAQPPQSSVPPQPSGAAPQERPRLAQVWGAQGPSQAPPFQLT
jgi:hypothetical protein